MCNSDENLPIKFNILVNNKIVSSAVTSVTKLRETPELTLKNAKTDAYAGTLKLTNF